ncbi:hypothetical protein KIW84_054332 [Lathyrus oleraceus]|uniref:Uncharacterized protein n=1 Tax=Pisum sativum TaxID=3888 RepID=A0A9D4WV35_PEA|nr:hypothetical protein KIW84_054332 [Pisum sativum]
MEPNHTGPSMSNKFILIGLKGFSKLSHLIKIAQDSNIASKFVEADCRTTTFFATADTRVVLIKLAFRLLNTVILDAFPVFKQQRFAKETLEISTPLANLLDLCTLLARTEKDHATIIALHQTQPSSNVFVQINRHLVPLHQSRMAEMVTRIVAKVANQPNGIDGKLQLEHNNDISSVQPRV